MPRIPSGLPVKNKHVQSVLINKKYYNLNSAKRKISQLGYYNYGMDETLNYYRFSQFNPGYNKKYFISKNNDDVHYVIEY